MFEKKQEDSRFFWVDTGQLEEEWDSRVNWLCVVLDLTYTFGTLACGYIW
jgi:hypothetical protein